MKFSINRAEFADALTVAVGVSASRTTKQSLRGVLLDAHDDFLLVAATDLEVGVRLHVTQVQVEKTGRVLVPADKISQIVRESSDEVLELEQSDQTLHVRGHDSHFQIFVLEADDFPPVPRLEEEADFELEVGSLRRMTEWTVFAAAKENTRYAINGILWDRKGELLTLVATDGRRLAKAVHAVTKGEDRWAIVPAKGMQLFARVIPESDDKVAVKITSNQILLQTPRATVSCVLLEGHFPKYEEVIPDDLDKTVVCDTRDMLSAVRRASLLTNEESKGVRLTFSKGNLKLSSRAPEQGEAVISLPIQYDSGEFEIGFNPEFLTNVLRVVSEDQVEFDFRESNRPGVFRQGDDFLYVVMPVSLS